MQLIGSADRDITVNYETNAVTATAGDDFVSAVDSVVFPVGTSSQTVSIIVNGDDVVEADETITLDVTGIIFDDADISSGDYPRYRHNH